MVQRNRPDGLLRGIPVCFPRFCGHWTGTLRCVLQNHVSVSLVWPVLTEPQAGGPRAPSLPPAPASAHRTFRPLHSHWHHTPALLLGDAPCVVTSERNRLQSFRVYCCRPERVSAVGMCATKRKRSILPAHQLTPLKVFMWFILYYIYQFFAVDNKKILHIYP